MRKQKGDGGGFRRMPYWICDAWGNKTEYCHHPAYFFFRSSLENSPTERKETKWRHLHEKNETKYKPERNGGSDRSKMGSFVLGFSASVVRKPTNG